MSNKDSHEIKLSGISFCDHYELFSCAKLYAYISMNMFMIIPWFYIKLASVICLWDFKTCQRLLRSKKTSEHDDKDMMDTSINS